MDPTLAVIQNKSHSSERWAAVHEHVNGTYQAGFVLMGFELMLICLALGAVSRALDKCWNQVGDIISECVVCGCCIFQLYFGNPVSSVSFVSCVCCCVAA